MKAILYIDDDLHTTVTFKESNTREYFYVQNDDTKAYYSAHGNGKHVYYTQNRDKWEQWRLEDIDDVKVLKSMHDTYLELTNQTIWQIHTIHSIDKLVKVRFLPSTYAKRSKVLRFHPTK